MPESAVEAEALGASRWLRPQVSTVTGAVWGWVPGSIPGRVILEDLSIPAATSAVIAHDGKMVGVLLTDAPVAAPSLPLSVTIDDGACQGVVGCQRCSALAVTALWDASAAVLWLPLPTRAKPTSVVTVVIPIDAIRTATGYIPAVSLVALNRVGQDLTPVAASDISMMVGQNMPPVTYYNTLPQFTDLAKLMTPWSPTTGGASVTLDADGNLTAITGQARKGYAATTDNGIPGTPRGWPAIPDGAYTVKYETTAGATVTKTVPVVSTPTAAASFNFVVSEPARNFRAYRPGADESQLYDPAFLDRIDGSVLRFMDSWGINGSTLDSIEDISTPGVASYFSPMTPAKSGNVVAVDTYANAEGLFPSSNGWAFAKITTDLPHGLSDAKPVTLSGFSNNLTLDNGRTVSLNTVRSAVVVLDDTNYAVATWVGSTGGKYTPTLIAGKWVAASGGSWPLEHMVTLCNQKRQHLWLNIPTRFDDASCAAVFNYIQANLRYGLKVYVEYSNEHWNSATGFMPYWHCSIMGKREGLTRTQWFTKRTGQIHAVGDPILGPRMARVFGSMYAGSTVTAEEAAYAVANGIKVDAIAIANYWQAKPRYTAAQAAQEPTIASLSNEQLMDMTEVQVYSGDTVRNIPKHRAALDLAGLTATEIIACEGGPELGEFTAANNVARSQMWQRHPRMGPIHTASLLKEQEAGITLKIDYTQSLATSAEHTWPRYWGYATERGVGDGSDGKFDNRTNYTDHARAVSPIAKSLRDWSDRQKVNAATA